MLLNERKEEIWKNVREGAEGGKERQEKSNKSKTRDATIFLCWFTGMWF